MGHKIVYDSDKNKIVLFGGRNGVASMNDTWEWDGTEWTQVADTGPSVRAFQSMAYDSSEKAVVLFGGYEDYSIPATLFGDTWKLKDHVWTKVSDMGPKPNAVADMIYTGKRIILFGGVDDVTTNHLNGDTWDWNGDLWVQRQNMGPLVEGVIRWCMMMTKMW